MQIVSVFSQSSHEINTFLTQFQHNLFIHFLCKDVLVLFSPVTYYSSRIALLSFDYRLRKQEESNVIEVNDLVKRYGNHTAVDHLSFTIEKGKIYGFLGPNGAGKSTTMNMITGYIASTEGTVKIDGHDILEEPEKAKKCIGYLPEQPPLYFDMTVLEYMRFAADLKKIPKKDKESKIGRAHV